MYSAVWVYAILSLIVCRYDEHNIPQQLDTPTEPTAGSWIGVQEPAVQEPAVQEPAVQEPAYAETQTPIEENA